MYLCIFESMVVLSWAGNDLPVATASRNICTSRKEGYTLTRYSCTHNVFSIFIIASIECETVCTGNTQL